eukprot:scaffold437_cov168-Ochromonas_danica.AAC.18
MRTGWRGSLQFQFEPSTLFFSLLTFVMLSLVTSYSKGLSVHLYRWQRLQRREIFVRSTVGGIMGITQSNEINLSHLQGTNSQISPYWIEQLKRLEKANAKALIAQLVADNPLGFESSAGAAANGGRSSSSPRSGTLLDYTIEQKKKHPNKIILIRSGEFYETYGIDALMLIAYAGLNPMGNKCKAGCPVRNVQATLDGLTSAGLSVAVYEEIAEIDLGRGGNGGVAGGKGAGGSKAKIKSRALTQIVSPASSTYIYDLCLRADDIEYRENRPAVGILSTASGFTLCQVYLDEHCMVVYERLTEEAVRSLISNSGAIDPLFLQDAADLSFLSNHHAIEKIHGHSEHTFPGEVLRKIGDLLDVRTKGFQIFHQAKYSANRPRPVYTSTALQVGLLPNDNVPNLIPHLLPKVSNAFAARFLRKWILNPPPHEIADEMQSLCTSLSQLTYSLPPFQPISIGKLVSLLSAKQCNVYLFRDVQKNAQSLQYILSHAEDYGRILPAMLTLTSFECGLPAESQYLLQATERVGQLIGSVIASEYEEDQPFQDPNKRIPDEFFRRNEEEWRGKVSLSNVQAKVIYDEVDQAASRLCEVLAREYPENCEIVHDMMENALMIKDMPIPRKTEESLSSSSEPNSEVAVTKPKGRNGRAGSKSGPCFAVPGVRYIPYIDRKGKLAAKRYTTEAVSEALNDYLTLAELAPRRIALILQELSENLKEDMISIVQSAHFAVILQTALSHTISAVQKGWAMPTLVDFPHQSTRSVKTRQGLGPSMAIKGLTPYWMPRTNAVSNDVDLRGIFLLTAPNMSGKSTLMRSVLIAALLANCGLYVPATEAKVPRFDTFFLRTASYDVPSEEKSAFALEMDDMRVVLRDCSDKSLVMIDELGKGTSARDGSALAGALLEHLDHKAVYGIFATHLHELFLLPLHLQHIQYKRMGYTTIEQEESSKDPVKGEAISTSNNIATSE